MHRNITSYLGGCWYSQEDVVVFLLFVGLVGIAVLQFGLKLVVLFSLLLWYNKVRCRLQIGHIVFLLVKVMGRCFLALHIECHLSLSSSLHEVHVVTTARKYF